MDFPLTSSTKDYDSKRSRAELFNLIKTGDQEGYQTVSRTEGLTLFILSPLSGIPRSNSLINGNLLYLVAGTRLFSVTVSGIATDLGHVGGSGRAQLEQNSAPAGNQICILNGTGAGYIFTVGGSLLPISDPDFFSTTSVTILNERFWFARDGTNEFFGSDISDGFSYDPLTFATAEEAPDDVVNVIAKKSALWVIGQRTTQYFQTFDDATLPLRAVKGVTKERGIAAQDSLAEIGEFFAYLADDGTVRLFTGTEMQKISTLELELKIKGNGTLTSPGFSKVDDAIGFFIDGPVHKVYVLTFPTEGYTWCYDLNTQLPHTRGSEDELTWRIGEVALFNNQRIASDLFTGDLWVLDPSALKEGTNVQRTRLRSASVTFEKNATIPLIEIDMEVGQPENPDDDPQMMVAYSKDGGFAPFTNHSTIPLGKIGQYKTRVPIRRFGRVVRNKDFILELETTDPVRIQYYGAFFEPRISM